MTSSWVKNHDYFLSQLALGQVEAALKVIFDDDGDTDSVLYLELIALRRSMFPLLNVFGRCLCFLFISSWSYFLPSLPSSSCHASLANWKSSLQDAQLVLRYLTALILISMTLHSSTPACLSMIYAKAEALFMLTNFEKSLLFYHNGLVRYG